jgi:hypothetical protein
VFGGRCNLRPGHDGTGKANLLCHRGTH